MKKSFTLIELLVVIAIIGLLVIIIAIPINRARRGASIARILQYEASLHRYLGSDIVGWWQFNEGEGSIAKDISGYSNDGTIHGATYVDGVPGKEGYALEFDGAGDYVNVENDNVLDLGDGSRGTVAVWVKANSWALTDEYPSIVKLGGTLGWAAGSYHISNWTGNLRFVIRTHTPSASNNVVSVVTPELGVWHHLVMTWSGTGGGKLSVYINGNFISSINQTIKADSHAGGNLQIARASNHYFNGKIDDVRIYSHALTSEQINTLYTETKNKYITEEL